MNKKLYVIPAALLALAACSDDKSTAGAAVEPNTVAEASSSSLQNEADVKDSMPASSSSFKISSSGATIDTIVLGPENDGLSTEDHAFIDSVLHAYGPTVYIDEYYSDSDTVYDITSASSVFYDFETEEERLFYHIGNTGSCVVSLYKDENGIQKMRNPKGVINNLYTFLKQNGKSQFVHYLWSSRYGYDAPEGSCAADSLAFVTNCADIGGALASFTEGCDKLEMTCIAKVDATLTLEELAKPMTNDCEEFVSNLPDEEVKPGVTCQGDSENGMVCDTTYRK